MTIFRYCKVLWKSNILKLSQDERKEEQSRDMSSGGKKSSVFSHLSFINALIRKTIFRYRKVLWKANNLNLSQDERKEEQSRDKSSGGKNSSGSAAYSVVAQVWRA